MRAFDLLLAATGAAAAVVSVRSETPGARSYTVLGCIDYKDDNEPQTNAAGETLLTLDECLTKRGGPPLLQVSMTQLNADGKGTCWWYRNNGPNITNLVGLATRRDGWCSTDQGRTAISVFTDASYVGCYDRVWFYQAPFRKGWGMFKPTKNRAVREIAHEVRNDTVVNVDYGRNIPIHKCIRNCQECGAWEGAIQTPQGECICVNRDLAKNAPVRCTGWSWRFYWAGGRALLRGANGY